MALQTLWIKSFARSESCGCIGFGPFGLGGEIERIGVVVTMRRAIPAASERSMIPSVAAEKRKGVAVQLPPQRIG